MTLYDAFNRHVQLFVRNNPNANLRQLRVSFRRVPLFRQCVEILDWQGYVLDGHWLVRNAMQVRGPLCGAVRPSLEYDPCLRRLFQLIAVQEAKAGSLRPRRLRRTLMRHAGFLDEECKRVFEELVLAGALRVRQRNRGPGNVITVVTLNRSHYWVGRALRHQPSAA